MEYYSAIKKKAFESVLMRWMKLEPIIQSEVERNTPIQYINTYIWNLEIVTMTLYARQQKRHRYKEQTCGLCGRRRGWDDLREQHWNMYSVICETDHQSKFDAWNRALKASAQGQPRGMGCGGRWRGLQDGGKHVHPWLIHVNVCQNHHSIVK